MRKNGVGNSVIWKDFKKIFFFFFQKDTIQSRFEKLDSFSFLEWANDENSWDK